MQSAANGRLSMYWTHVHVDRPHRRGGFQLQLVLALGGLGLSLGCGVESGLTRGVYSRGELQERTKGKKLSHLALFPRHSLSACVEHSGLPVVGTLSQRTIRRWIALMNVSFHVVGSEASVHTYFRRPVRSLCKTLLPLWTLQTYLERHAASLENRQQATRDGSTRASTSTDIIIQNSPVSFWPHSYGRFEPAEVQPYRGLFQTLQTGTLDRLAWCPPCCCVRPSP